MSNKRKDQLKELILYGICGALTTILDIGIFWFLANIVNLHYLVANAIAWFLHYLVANAIAWFLAITFSFLANKYYVFESKSFARNVWVKEAAEFFGARGLSCVVDMGGMFLLVSILGINKNYAKLFINLVVIVINYILSKFWIFKKS